MGAMLHTVGVLGCIRMDWYSCTIGGVNDGKDMGLANSRGSCSTYISGCWRGVVRV